MPATTKGFPYPAPTAPSNVPADFQALAQAVDTKLDSYLPTASYAPGTAADAAAASAAAAAADAAAADADRIAAESAAASAAASAASIDPATLVHVSDKGAVNGVASLDAGGKVPTTQLPALVPLLASTNTFTASQIVEVTDNANPALRVTQLGTGYALRVEDSANPDATPFVIDAVGNVGVGLAAPTQPLEVAGSVYLTPDKNGYLYLGRRDAGFPYSIINAVGSASGIAFQVEGVECLRLASTGLITGTGTSLGAWTAYTPTITPVSGLFTTVSASGFYCQIGKTVHVAIRVIITTNGTASGVVASLPFTSKSNIDRAGVGRESNLTGKMLQFQIPYGTASGYIRYYDNTAVNVDGATLNITATYEVA